MGLHSINYLSKLTSTILSRTLFVEIKILYQMIESNFRQKSKEFKKFPVLCEISRKFLNKSDKSASLVIKECRQISSRYIIWSLLINESLDAVDILKKPVNICFLELFLASSTQLLLDFWPFSSRKDSGRQIFRII